MTEPLLRDELSILARCMPRIIAATGGRIKSVRVLPEPDYTSAGFGPSDHAEFRYVEVKFYPSSTSIRVETKYFCDDIPLYDV